jgi:hypothetical protein
MILIGTMSVLPLLLVTFTFVRMLVLVPEHTPGLLLFRFGTGV